jgi:1-acyl-sn-glycerol-3-phosphate acyltransferase
MGDVFYNMIRMAFGPPFWFASEPVVLHRHRIPRRGGCIVASNHLSPYDIALLILSTPRHVDFLSIVEMERKKFVGPFYAKMNVVFIDRSLADSGAALALAKRLRRGRVVGIFPEGQIRTEAKSVISGGSFKPGTVRLAQLARVPIIPTVVLDAAGFSKPLKWLPLRTWQHGIIYGEPIHVPHEGGADAVRQGVAQLKSAYVALYKELRNTLGPPQ